MCIYLMPLRFVPFERVRLINARFGSETNVRLEIVLRNKSKAMQESQWPYNFIFVIKIHERQNGTIRPGGRGEEVRCCTYTNTRAHMHGLTTEHRLVGRMAIGQLCVCKRVHRNEQ